MAQKAIVGEKVGMTQVWGDDQRIIPVTVLRVEPARVVQVKTGERDGYSALQVTYGSKDAKKLTKAQAGHFAKANVASGRRLVELRLDSVDGFAVGQEIAVDTLAPGELVDVTAVSRGKGFAGGMKRHKFGGQGAIITEVESDSPADVAGIKVDDVVLSVNGEPITGQAGLVAAIRDRSPGDTVEIEILRGGERVTVKATLVARPKE